MAGSIAGSESGRPPIAPKPQPPAGRRQRSGPINLDDPAPPPDNVSRSWSGEQRQINRTLPSRSRTNSNTLRPEFGASQPLVTVQETSPYIQNPNAAVSTGSLTSVHSNRLQFDRNGYEDPAFLIQSDLTADLERAVGAPRPPSDSDKQPKLVPTKMGKRISKVLKFGKK